MKKLRLLILLLVAALAAGGIYYQTARRPGPIVLTGLVTTDEVMVSSEIQGRLQHLYVREGDVVTNGELLGLIQPEAQQADFAFFASSEQQSAAQVAQARADLKFEEEQTSNQIAQAGANLASAQAQVAQAAADLENAKLTFQREEMLKASGAESAQAFDQARTAYDGATARSESLSQQAQAAESAVAMAKANAEQVAARHAALDASLHQLAAAGAQKDKARVQLGYTEIQAPLTGLVDTRAALQGEVVNPGQAIVTLINPDDLWVRADVEETYIDRLRLGDQLPVRLPSGAVLTGTVFYRRVDADYATQRDVSRSKRDIKTFEIRLRCDNTARRLAVGMTASVTLPPVNP
jgi:multidrug resistance efflux pump